MRRARFTWMALFFAALAGANVVLAATLWAKGATLSSLGAACSVLVCLGCAVLLGEGQR